MGYNVIARAASSDHKVVATLLQFRWPGGPRAKRKGSVVIGGPIRGPSSTSAIVSVNTVGGMPKCFHAVCSLLAMLLLMFRSED